MEEDPRVESDLGSRRRGSEDLSAQTEQEPHDARPMEHTSAMCKPELGGLEVREKPISPDSCIGVEEPPDGSEALRGLQERVSDLEGLLKNKELSERDLSQRVSRLDQRLEEKCRKERLLLARCARLQEELGQKEVVEVRLQERYSQVEELQQEWEASEGERDEQIQTLVDEIAERDVIQAQLEEERADMARRMEEMALCKRRLEARLLRLEGELAGAGCEAGEPGVPLEETKINPAKTPSECVLEDVIGTGGRADSPNGGRQALYRRIQGARSTEGSQSPEPPLLDTDGDSSRVARLETLLELREEMIAELQGRLGSQEQLLRDVRETQGPQETQGRLSAPNEELGDEAHCWRMQGVGLEQRERERRAEAGQLRDTVAQLEALSASLESRLTAKASELQALEATREREASGLWSDLRKLTSDQADREAVWLSDRQGLEAQLRKRSRELEVSEEQRRKLRQAQEALEEEQCRLRQAEGTLAQKNRALDAKLSHLSQLLSSAQDSLSRERQMANTAKTQLTAKEQRIKALLEQEAALHVTITHLQEQRVHSARRSCVCETGGRTTRPLRVSGERQGHGLSDGSTSDPGGAMEPRVGWVKERVRELSLAVPDSEAKGEAVIVKFRVDTSWSFQDLERAQRERTTPTPEEPAVAAEVAPELQVLSQRVKVLEHSLRDNVNTFTESEAALHNRIKELEVSERSLLVKVDDLTVRSGAPCPVAPRQRQEDKLHMLREEVHSMALDKERCDRVWKERLHRCQSQVKMKEEEMKRQAGEAGPAGTPTPEGGGGEEEEEEERIAGGERRLKSFISSLQEDLRVLLGREEAGFAERRGLREGLQEAEDNVEFLTHKLEDFRSRIHQLKLSEGALLEEVEELAEENERLRGSLRAQSQVPDPTPDPSPALNPAPSPPCGAEPGHQEPGPVESADPIGVVGRREEQMQLNQEAPPCLTRDKAVQTPSIPHCVREAITVAKLIPQLGGASQCPCEGLLEGSFHPLLESNCWDVAEIMQALRCGGVEQVKQTLQQMESQSKLPLLECESAPMPAHSEGAVESSQAEVVLKTVVLQSQPDLLKLCGHRNQNTNLISLVTKTIEVDCNSADNSVTDSECSFRSYSFGTFTPPSEGTNSMKETVLNLESEVESLRNDKKELESILHSQEEALQRVSEDIARLKMSQTGGSYEGWEASAGERGDLQLETLKNNWRQENKVLARRNEELLDQMAKLEGDYERELAQLRLQISLQERDMGQLEEENGQQGCVIAELQKKTEDDLNVVLELQDALREKSDQIALLQSKVEDDLNVVLVLQDALREKESGQAVCQEEQNNQEDVTCGTSAPESQESIHLKQSLEESREALSLLEAAKTQQQEIINGLEDERRRDSQSAAGLREEVTRLSRLASGLEGELREARAERDGLEERRQDLHLRLERLGQAHAGLVRKVEEQQEALRISSEMISDLQDQRDTGAREVARLQEAHAASQRDLRALREVSEAARTQLLELGV
ncbi:hypothetical protein AAFF_G00108230 [Aldrovandia affinis]|uniref:Uncharacterized protein n=1 Tax=Aldrovandia affinis TaxID=143900 RepID=A0AAD7WBW7_9TELE|nr:hypothetical protein AAFF_G00108230 [Aldrovandia affinis]